MKLRCDRKSFETVVGLAAGVVPVRPTRPILHHVLLHVEGDRATVQATDLELFMTCRLSLIQCTEPGRLALPAQPLQQILRESTGSVVDLSTDGSLAVLKTTGGIFRLSGDSADDFPTGPSEEGESFLELEADRFRELVNFTQFAASRELGRYAVNGILVSVEEGTIRFVATDGKRLAVAAVPFAGKVEECAQILPLKGILQFQKALGPEDKTIGLSLSGKKTMLRTRGAMLSAVSIDARFPPYKEVIPKPGFGRTVQLARDLFFSCVRQTAVMAGDDSPTVTLTFGEGSLVFSSHVEGRGDARVEMAVDYAGEPTILSFNPQFFLDFSKVDLPAEFGFEFLDADTAGVFRIKEGVEYFVMPVNH